MNKRGAAMKVCYFDRTTDPISLPLEELLTSLRAKEIEHDARQIVWDLDTKGWHTHQRPTPYSIVRTI
jgi:hypothetical protein